MDYGGLVPTGLKYQEVLTDPTIDKSDENIAMTAQLEDTKYWITIDSICSASGPRVQVSS